MWSSIHLAMFNLIDMTVIFENKPFEIIITPKNLHESKKVDKKSYNSNKSKNNLEKFDKLSDSFTSTSENDK